MVANFCDCFFALVCKFIIRGELLGNKLPSFLFQPLQLIHTITAFLSLTQCPQALGSADSQPTIYSPLISEYFLITLLSRYIFHLIIISKAVFLQLCSVCRKSHPKGWLFCVRYGIIKQGDKNAAKG